MKKLESGELDIVDEIRSIPIALPSEYKLKEKDKPVIRSLAHAACTYQEAYPWFSKLSKDEKKLVWIRFNLSFDYFQDSRNESLTPYTKMMVLSIACEILVDLISKIILKCLKHGEKLDRSFKTRHAVKMRWGFNEKLFVIEIRLKVEKNKEKISDPLGNSAKNLLKIINRYKNSNKEFIREKVFTHGRYFHEKKFKDYLINSQNPELAEGYRYLFLIFLLLKDDEPIGIGGTETELIIAIPKIKEI